MIYTQEHYQQEQLLISQRLLRHTDSRKYSKKYFKVAVSLIEEMFANFQFNPNLELLNHPLVIQAFEVAKEAHKDQSRKYTYEPYLNHLSEVATIISSLENSSVEDIVAAILHDVVEKGGHSLEQIKEKFGDIVHNHLIFLTDDKNIEAVNRDDRIKKLFLKFTECPSKTNNIKIADILSNTRSTILCDIRYNETYLSPILEYMNPYFQQSEHTDVNLKKILNNVCEISKKQIEQQKSFGIHKIEKKLAAQERAAKKNLKKQLKIN